eukprot:15364853-Ditylum_brightwellii.AAC.1
MADKHDDNGDKYDNGGDDASQEITKIKTTDIHCDGSDNGCIFNKLDYFTFFQPTKIKVEQVTGSKEACAGWGCVIVQVPNSSLPLIPLWSAYYMPDNLLHTLSTQALK